MASQAQDTQGFVKGVIRYVKAEGGDSALLPKAEKLLKKMSVVDRMQNNATVKSSLELNAEQKNSIKSTLEVLVGHELSVDYVYDETLIAGLRIQIGDFVIDTSFSNQLDRIASSLLQIT